MWSRDPHLVPEAIDKVERAWSLTRDPAVAVQLVTMYDRVNRNDDALIVLREAFRDHPRDALLRHHAAITVLRHGDPADVRDFFDAVLKIDASDAFARFVVTLLDAYDTWVGQLASSIEAKRDGRQPLLFSLPVWGQPFSAYFARYFCAALLSPNNLPAIVDRHAVHFAIFTTEETEAALRAEPLFCRLEDYATVHFVRYGVSLVNYKAAMEACYGAEKVPHSENSLAFYYGRNCKFALMSCAHYVALAAGRATDALVSCVVADTILNDGALPRIAALMQQADAVLVHSIQLPGKVVRPILDQELRTPDGSLVLSSDTYARLVVSHLPEANFVDTAQCLDPPLRIAWRVGKDGVLVHANHYHPLCLRPAALDRPLRLSIDPIDSRFLDRNSLEIDRIHLVQDSGIAGLSIDDDPILEASENSIGPVSVPAFALWLWGYWGRLRGPLFRTPIRFGVAMRQEEWQPVEAAAATLVDAIVARADQLENGNRARRSWRL
jgi:hypothetical protein